MWELGLGFDLRIWHGHGSLKSLEVPLTARGLRLGHTELSAGLAAIGATGTEQMLSTPGLLPATAADTLDSSDRSVPADLLLRLGTSSARTGPLPQWLAANATLASSLG